MMRIVFFTHSLVSCWNHGNAHFLRGVIRSLVGLGHDVAAYEPSASWSRDNLSADQAIDPFIEFGRRFPGLTTQVLAGEAALEQAVHGADLVIVHEWNEPSLVAAIGRHRKSARFQLLFHDTHHRAVSDPDAIRRFDLQHYDGILAFGATLAAIYEEWGWRNRAWVWHEAADTVLFHPPLHPRPRCGAIWIGNWGDGERTSELEQFLLAPARAACLALDVHGVRYPQPALDLLVAYGARYHGWIANAAAPEAFATHALTVHVPRRFYTQMLPGIPTIRVFEALACGIPLICAPWEDSEGLFEAGADYLVARDSHEMERHMRDITGDPGLAAQLAQSGLARIQARHSCMHRARELLLIASDLSTIKVAA